MKRKLSDPCLRSLQIESQSNISAKRIEHGCTLRVQVTLLCTVESSYSLDLGLCSECHIFSDNTYLDCVSVTHCTPMR